MLADLASGFPPETLQLEFRFKFYSVPASEAKFTIPYITELFSSLSLTFSRHAWCVYCGTLRPHLAKIFQFWSPLPSDPLELSRPQAFVCLSCSIYTLFVWNSAQTKNFRKIYFSAATRKTNSMTREHCCWYIYPDLITINYSTLSLCVRLPVCVFMGCRPHLSNATPFYFYRAFGNHNTATRRGNSLTHAQ